jgi:dimethylglycine dehydrogenase
MLTPAGRIFGDVTVLHVESDRLVMMGSPAAEPTYIRWLTERQRAGVTIRSVTQRYSGLALTGPHSRRILSAVTRTDVSGEHLPFLHLKMLLIGCAEAMVARISFTGELGFEIYMDPSDIRHVYEALHAAGREFGLKNFGVRALNCLRLEKAYGSWGREYTQDVTPAAARLSRFVRTDKPAFVGREAVLAQAQPAERTLALLRIETSDLDPSGGEPVFVDGVSVARLTSAAHSYHFNCGLGFAFLPTQLSRTATIEVDLLDGRHPAAVLSGAPYDPSGQRLRS